MVKTFSYSKHLRETVEKLDKPLKNIQQYGSHWNRFQSSHKIRKVLHQSKVFCDLKIILLTNISSDNKPVKEKKKKHDSKQKLNRQEKNIGVQKFKQSKFFNKNLNMIN